MGEPLVNLGALNADRAVQLDAALCGLVVWGSRLGELETREVMGVDGKPRTIKVPPRIWLERLDRALAVGAFDRLPVDKIVERILIPPDPGKSPFG
jgi:hypothetical protein